MEVHDAVAMTIASSSAPFVTTVTSEARDTCLEEFTKSGQTCHQGGARGWIDGGLSLTPDKISLTYKHPLGVFTLVTRGWAASEFLTRASKFNMMPIR